MPSVNKVYTHVAGDIVNLDEIASEFNSSPTYNNGSLCFPALASGKTGEYGASIMANKCYDVNFFYTQEEKVAAGTAFLLYYKPTDKLYEGLAGKSDSFKVVKEADNIINTNGITGKNFTNFSFDVNSAKATITPTAQEPISGIISSDKTLTADKVWVLKGLVTVNNGATLTIEPGTTVLGAAGTGAATSYLVIDKGAKIMAEGTQANPIIFKGETAYDGGANEWGQWGGITIIGNAGNAQVGAYEADSSFTAGTSDLADNSGVLKYIELYNSGITMETDKELNGMSFVGVGSGTTVDNIKVEKSDDDCMEFWGGTVNVSNISLAECSDDQFDIDDGYSGTVTNLTIVQTTGNAAMEMSGNTAATFENLNITVNNSSKEGGIYFKGDGTGGHFKNGSITYNVSNSYGAFHSNGAFDSTNTSFTNFTLGGTSTDKFTGPSATSIENLFDIQD